MNKLQKPPQLSPLKQAFLKIEELEARLRASEQDLSAPIAIVGMGCRFPGGADNPDAYWQLLADGVDAIREVPADRWDIDAYFNADPATPGTMSTRWGGFLSSVADFEPELFGIAPREARSMDPQQRLLLEVVWEALEDGGIAPTSLEGTRLGVFVGMCSNDWAMQRVKHADVAEIDGYFASGIALSIASGRVSYVLGAQGPSVTLDTACSSSLVAIHLACQALRTRECPVAVAGGVNVLLSPEITVALSQSSMMAPDGRCKTFDSRANGYVRGEGCGMLVLKRLTDALENGDRVHAVIRGSAVTQDGPSSGLTVPNGPAQEDVIRRALANGGVEPLDVDYVEAHGTGTSLGDPIEVQALDAVLGRGRTRDRALRIGSVKTNFGHLESAAGVAGLMKLVLAMRHGEIPRQLHLQQPNPHIRWDSMPIEVVTEITPWERTPGKARIGSVSSFGFSGTNAHIVLAEAPSPNKVERQPERPLHIFTLSAQGPDALEALAERHAARLDTQRDIDLGSYCFTANSGRALLPERLCARVRTAAELSAGLRQIGRKEAASGFDRAAVTSPDQPRIAFLFSGQGAQYADMGRTLFETQPTFRRMLERCDAALAPHIGESLIDILYGTADAAARLDETGITQPALFAIELALAELWRSWGIEAVAVLGHSVGEFAAACHAGALSLEDGAYLIATRARLMQALPSGGAMAAIAADRGVVERAIEPFPGELSIAAFNGPESIVVSGAEPALADVLAKLAEDGVESSKLRVSHAFHSPLMEPMMEDFKAAAMGVTQGRPEMTFVSCLTGERLGSEAMSADYWTRHVREPVRFADAMHRLADRRIDIFMEIGPHSTLLGMGGACVDDGLWIPSLRRGRDDWEQILESLSRLYLRGVRVDWRGFDRDCHRQVLDAPTYPFQRRRLWIDDIARGRSGALPTARAMGSGERGHPFLAPHSRSPRVKAKIFDVSLDHQALPYLADHCAFDTPVVPATFYFEAALSAARMVEDIAWMLEDTSIEAALEIPEGSCAEAQVILTPLAGDAWSFEFISFESDSDDDRTHARGTLRRASAEISGTSADIDELQARLSEGLAPERCYEIFAARGMRMGPSFRRLSRVLRGKDEALAEIAELDIGTTGYAMHPAFLDGCLQAIALAAFSEEELTESDGILMPVGLERLNVLRRGASPRWSRVRTRPATDGVPSADIVIADIDVFDADGNLVAKIDGLTSQRVTSEALQAVFRRGQDDWLYTPVWRRTPLREKDANGDGSIHDDGTRLILDASDSMGARLVEQLEARGRSVLRIDLRGRDESAGPSWPGLDSAGPEDYRRLLGTLDPAFLADCRGSIFIADDTTTISPPQDYEAQPASTEMLAQTQRCGARSLLYTAHALTAIPELEAARLYVVTRATQAALRCDDLSGVANTTLWGLAKAVAFECPELRCTLVDLGTAQSVEEVEALTRELLGESPEEQVALRGQERFVARLIGRSQRAPGDQRQLKLATPGVLDSLSFAKAERVPPSHGEVEIETYATGLNFRDVLMALGLYPGDDPAFGSECAGRVSALGDGVDRFEVGDAVFGLVGSAFSRFATVHADQVARIPDHLSFEDAAAIPTAFLTAYYTLIRLAKLSPGESVLIHAASGGVGQAAVQIALDAGAEVFATAGSDEKRALVRALGVSHVMDSRSLDFAEEILTATGGQGVDVVLNSLAGEFIEKSVAALKSNGRFVEIGKRDVWDQERLAAVKANARFFLVDLGNVGLEDPKLGRELLEAVMAKFASGALRPLPRLDFGENDVVEAFRFMQQARHVGKLVVARDTRRKIEIHEDGAYLLTGGLGALGIHVAQKLAELGARRLVLVGRSAPGPAAKRAIRGMEEQGARVTIELVDVADEAAMGAVFERLKTEGVELRGIFHAAGVIDDAVLSQQTWDRFERVFAAKVAGAWNLHRLTIGARLDFFVLFSSVAGLLGSPGQANYAAANAFLDGLALYRRRQGLAATSVDWGAWGDEGLAAKQEIKDRFAARGMRAFSPEQGLSAFERVLESTERQLAVMAVDWSRFLLDERPSLRGTLFAEVAPQSGVQTADETPSPAILGRLREAKSLKRRQQLLTDHVREIATNVLGLDASRAPRDSQPLRDVGLDSLMAVELRNLIRSSLSLPRALPATLAFDYPSIEELVKFLSTLIADFDTGTAATQEGETGRRAAMQGESHGRRASTVALRAIEELSDEDVDRALAPRLGKGKTDGLS